MHQQTDPWTGIGKRLCQRSASRAALQWENHSAGTDRHRRREWRVTFVEGIAEQAIDHCHRAVAPSRQRSQQAQK
jgi:hypothetical protein